MIVMATMIVTLVWLGFYPQPVIDAASPGLTNLQRVTSGPHPRPGEP
jgi:NADH:ubiquinone oxidoreductase subunit 4 (subunit M)